MYRLISAEDGERAGPAAWGGGVKNETFIAGLILSFPCAGDKQ